MPSSRSARPRSSFLATLILATVAAILLYALVSMSRETPIKLAPTHEFKTRSRVGINYAKRTFFGRVRSQRARCRRSRTVVLVKTRGRLSDILVRRKITGSRGRYRMQFEQRPTGRFYATVIPRGRPGYLHWHRCRGDKSRVIRAKPRN